MLKNLDAAIAALKQHPHAQGMDWDGYDRLLTSYLMELAANYFCSASVITAVADDADLMDLRGRKRRRRRRRTYPSRSEAQKDEARQLLRSAVSRGTIPMSALAAPHFQYPWEARKYLEAIRWPDGTVCPHCGTIDRAYKTKREGVYRCGEPKCRKDFSVTTKTVMESSHIPLHKWMQGFYLMASSKKGVSAHQLHRTLKITYKSAWFMAHRIREAMRDGALGPLGGNGGVVEADETYFGRHDQPVALKKPRQCEKCFDTVPSYLLHGHHTDYAKPYDVEWLCTDCHAEAHNGGDLLAKDEVTCTPEGQVVKVIRLGRIDRPCDAIEKDQHASEPKN